MLKPGYVYVLSNPSLPGMVKIGRSTRGGSHRAKELYQTGLPTPFSLEFEIFEPFDHFYLEQIVHDRLNSARTNEAREFFSVTINEAVEAILDSYLTQHFYKSVADLEDVEAIMDLRTVARSLGHDEREVVAAARHFTSFAISQALYVWRKLLESRRKARGTTNG